MWLFELFWCSFLHGCAILQNAIVSPLFSLAFVAEGVLLGICSSNLVDNCEGMCLDLECGSGGSNYHGQCDKTAYDYIDNVSTLTFGCMVR